MAVLIYPENHGVFYFLILCCKNEQHDLSPDQKKAAFATVKESSGLTDIAFSFDDLMEGLADTLAHAQGKLTLEKTRSALLEMACPHAMEGLRGQRLPTHGPASAGPSPRSSLPGC